MKVIYSQREGSPLWVDSDRRVNRKDAILLLLDQAAEHRLDPQDYSRDPLALMKDQLKTMKGSLESRLPKIAAVDIAITAALLTLGREVALGRSLPSALDPRWKARRAAPDFVGTLMQLADGPLDNWLDRLRPQHAERHASRRTVRPHRASLQPRLRPGRRTGNAVSLRAPR